MRAQFATVEAIISLLAILAAISFVSGEISLSSASAYAARSRAIQSMALYDAAGQMVGNRSANECVALSRSPGDSACVDALTESYKEAFGLRHFGLAFQGHPSSNATGNDTFECVPIRLVPSNATEEVCIVAGR